MKRWEKQALVDEARMCIGRARLNGADAVICGTREPFATVSTTVPNAPFSATFAWSTVKRIMEQRNGEFTS